MPWSPRTRVAPLRLLALAAALAAALLGRAAGRPEVAAAPLAATASTVTAAVETDPVPHSGDSADDLAIWIHPSDPALSTIIATDKAIGREGVGGGLIVYDLAGNELQYLSVGGANNVDLRYNFPLGGEPTDLVVAGNKRYNSIVAYRIDPATRRLENVTVDPLGVRIALPVYGTCMYRSPVSGKYYVFMTKSPHTDSPDDGAVEQWELFDSGGRVGARKVRTFFVGSDSEGCVADDVYATLFVAQTAQGVWRYGAEPGDGDARAQVASFSTGELSRGLEGVSLYYTSQGAGYLIVSNQGVNRYVVYRREPDAEGRHAYVATFRIAAGGGVDGVTDTDGLDVTNAALGPAFPGGVFVAQDGVNTVGATSATANQNFKLVSWAAIAAAASPPLQVDTSWDPRAVGAGEAPPTATPTATGTATPTRAATGTPTATSSAAASTNTTTATPPGSATPQRQAAPSATPTREPGAAPQLWLPLLRASG